MDALHDEVESLEAILMDDVHITKNSEDIPVMISTTVFPIVGEDTDKQYVCVTLEVIPTPGYPDVSPEFRLIKPRGLDDARLNEIKTACDAKLTDCVGCPVVFDLIEVIREHLTGSNLPSGQCVVCLYGFQEGDEFVKTECYHYLHSYCLARHLIAARRNYRDEQEKLPPWLQKTAKPFEASCPVCRERISDDESSLKTAMPPAELENAPDFCLTDDLKKLQKKMMNLFLKQKSRGAIIDSEAESGPVISIQPPEVARRERSRNSDSNCSNVSTDDQHSGETRDLAGTYAQASNSRSSQNPNSSNQKSLPQAKQSTNMPKQSVKESTNNNSHHNRRHNRGGRRHQNHHYHQYHSGRHETSSEEQHSAEDGATGGGQGQTQQNQHHKSHGSSGKSHKYHTAAGSSKSR